MSLILFWANLNYSVEKNNILKVYFFVGFEVHIAVTVLHSCLAAKRKMLENEYSIPNT
jgi:hypothetical protein